MRPGLPQDRLLPLWSRATGLGTAATFGRPDVGEGAPHAVLAAEPTAYGAYAAAIRREYAHVPEPLWRAGRAAVLERFLARERIYGSRAFAPLEASARSNLSAEREALLCAPEA